MIVFTRHAEIKLRQRSIVKSLVIQTIENPDFTSQSRGGRTILYKKFGKLYLSVIIKIENDDTVVITAHWVEKVKRF